MAGAMRLEAGARADKESSTSGSSPQPPAPSRQPSGQSPEPKGQSPLSSYGPADIEWQPLRRWRSPRTAIEYPVEWRVRAGDEWYLVRPLFDDQESDSRRSTGTIYWEGAVELVDQAGAAIGRGYLELTGYGTRLRF